jgi:hypothetical protein
MTKTMPDDDPPARDAEATRRLIEEMRRWNTWTLRWMVLVPITLAVIYLLLR